MQRVDLIIVGAGPSGLACAIEAQRAGMSHLVIEKGGITDAIRRFPVNMTFFSTPDRLEIGDIPFTCTSVRPNRIETLEYYRRVVETFDLNVSIHTTVDSIEKQDDGSFLLSTSRGQHRAANVVVATGYFDNVNKLGIPGEERPEFSHYYDEPYAYAHSDVVVIGGRNSAVEIALDLYRHGARVTMVHRKAELGQSVKSWIMPDILNRIEEGSIRTRFNSDIIAFRPGQATICHNPDQSTQTIPADFVFAMTGYRPDEQLLRGAGVELNGELIPNYDEVTFETNIPGLYIAGSVACGCETWNIFIENGREHAKPIINHITTAKNG